MPKIAPRWLAKAWAFVAVLLPMLAASLLNRSDLSFGVRLLLSLMPVVPMVLYLRFIVKCLQGSDELIRKIQMEGIFTAFVGSGLAVMTYGLLVKGRMLPDVSMADVWPYAWLGMLFLWGVGAFAAGRRYR